MESIMPIITGLAEERLIFLVIALGVVGILLIILIILQNLSKKARKKMKASQVTLDSIFSDKKLIEAIAINLGVTADEKISTTDLLGLNKLVVEYADVESLNGIGQLKNLEEVSFNNNKIKEIPAEIAELKKLESIQLAYNDLHDVSPLATNEAIKRVDISGNKATEHIDKLYETPNLEELVMINTGLKSISPAIEKAQKLKQLNVSYNDLQTLPKEVGNIPHLEVLNVGNNKLSTLPMEISKSMEIKELGLSGNAFESIPDEVQDLMRSKKILIPKITENLTDSISQAELPKVPVPNLGVSAASVVKPVEAAMALADKIDTPKIKKIVPNQQTPQKESGEKEMNKTMNTFIDLTSSHDNLLAELEALEVVKPKAEQALEGIVESVTSKAKAAATVVDNAKENVAKVATTIKDDVVEGAENIREDILDVTEDTKEKVGDMFNDMKGAVDEMDNVEIPNISEVTYKESEYVPAEADTDKKDKYKKLAIVSAGVVLVATAVGSVFYFVQKDKEAKRKKRGFFGR